MSASSTSIPYRGAIPSQITSETAVPLARFSGSTGETAYLTATFAGNGLVHCLRLQYSHPDAAAESDESVMVSSTTAHPFAATIKAIATLLDQAGATGTASMRAEITEKAQKALVQDFSLLFATTRMKYTTAGYTPPDAVVCSSQASIVASFGPHRREEDPEVQASIVGVLLDALYKGSQGEGVYAAAARSRFNPDRALVIRVNEDQCSVSLIFDLDPSLIGENEVRRPDISIHRDDCKVGSALTNFWKNMNNRGRDWGHSGEEHKDEMFEDDVLPLLCVAAEGNLREQVIGNGWNIAA